MRRGALVGLALVLVSLPAAAQESRFAADVRREGEAIAKSCDTFGVKAIGGCTYTLATESPFHLAFGSLAPQNGFAFGLAFNEHYTPNEAWRITWSTDAVVAPSGSWRAGVYMKLVHTPATSGVIVRQPGSEPSASATIAPREFAVVDLFAQAISLDTLYYFGEGRESLESQRSAFGERETILGGSVAYPIGIHSLRWLRPALLGGVSGRFVNLRRADTTVVPQTGETYNEATAPGLARQDGFAEFREGVRLKPSVANGWLRFNYLLSAQQFVTTNTSGASFNRWTADLRHEIPLYRGASSTGPREFNGPNECRQGPASSKCPPVQWSRNRTGAINLRLLVTESTTGNGNRVPFYLQPTLGGSDVNGERSLAGFQDYRFRGPNLLLLQEGAEHSLWGPVGAFLLLEQGKVAASRSEIDFSNLARSTTVGLTVRAGGFPMINLSFSWSREGHHVVGSISPTLLGGSSRPSLY
jgi:hypothetical protein